MDLDDDLGLQIWDSRKRVPQGLLLSRVQHSGFAWDPGPQPALEV